jgi:hypothetical protein
VWFCSFNEIHSKFKTNKIERETMMHINLSHNIRINCIFGAIFFFFNVDVRASLCVPRLISRVLKLTTM